MKILIIALFISFTLAYTNTKLSITAAADSTDACSLDVSISQASGETATDTNTGYGVLASCTTAPTDGAIANLRAAGCAFVAVKGVAESPSYSLYLITGLTNTTIDVTAHNQPTGTYVNVTTGCTAATSLSAGTTVCTGVATMVKGAEYYWSLDPEDVGSFDLATFNAITNSCGVTSSD